MNLFADLGWNNEATVEKPKEKIVVQILDYCFYCDAQLSHGVCSNPECQLNKKKVEINKAIRKQRTITKVVETPPSQAEEKFKQMFVGEKHVAKKLVELNSKPWWTVLTAPQRKGLIDRINDYRKQDTLNKVMHLEQEINAIYALGKPIKVLSFANRLADLEIIEPPAYEVKEKYSIAPRSSDIEVRRTSNARRNISNWEIYNSYSGNGKLSDITFKDCADFADYTDKKKEFELGQFFTPDYICREIIGMIQPEPNTNVADICCGMGRFFNYVPECNLLGIDKDPNTIEIADRLFHDNNNSFYGRAMNQYPSRFVGEVDYSVGNPPFNLYYWADKSHPLRSQSEQVVSQNDYVYQNRLLLKNGGALAFIVPKTWLTDELRHGKINQFIKENFYFIAELDLPDTTFEEYQVTFPTKIIFLVKRIPNFEFPLEKFTGSSTEFTTSQQYKWYHSFKAALKKNQCLKGYIDKKNNAIEKEKERSLNNKLKKLIFKIKQLMPDKVDEMTTKIKNEILSLQHVNKPWGMKEKDWEERKPTKLKIFKKYHKQICRKHIKDLWIRICQDKHCLKITTSNAQASAVLNKWLQSEDWESKKIEWWKLVIPKWSKAFLAKLEKLEKATLSTESTVNHPTGRSVEIKSDFNWSKLLKKKEKEFQLNRADFSRMEELYPKEYASNKAMLEPMVFPDKEFGEVKLLPHQVEDLSSILIKDRALLSWSMGLGKTIAGLVWANNKGKRTLVVAPACNLIDPWQQEIDQRIPGTNFLVITKRSDWRSFTGEEKFLVVSLEALPSYEKLVARYKFDTLILDESDNIKNKASKRAKVLKKLAKRCDKILCMTGTPTRNNAVEIYNQAELLLNNSASMLCTVETIQIYDRYFKEYREEKNPIYMEPYPAYGGLAVFRKCFSPKKTTVFGAEKTNQTIYNKKELEEFMKPIRMTRIFEDEKPRIDEVLGREKTGEKDSDIHQELVPMTKHEGEVYKFILGEFIKELQAYFEAKGHDSKTARMLIIVRQIMSLLQAVSHPWTFASYDGPKVTSKMKRTAEIFEIAKTENRKVLFGSPWVPTINYYEEYFRDQGIPIFTIKQAMSKTKRAAVINRFKAYSGFAVLMGTIGCLKSGLSIPEVSIVITDSLTWNWATYNQFISRAIRLTSKRIVDVYALCNKGSFDVNVFSLMMKKEKINQFIRRGVEGGDKEFIDKFGANTDIFEEAVKMVKTKVNGHMIGKIEWNEQALIDSDLAPSE